MFVSHTLSLTVEQVNILLIRLYRKYYFDSSDRMVQRESSSFSNNLTSVLSLFTLDCFTSNTSKHERVGQCEQIITSNLHNLPIVAVSSFLCEHHFSPFGYNVYLSLCLIFVALQAIKLVFRKQLWYVGREYRTYTGSGGRPANCISPSCLCPPSLPACLPALWLLM